MQASQTSHAGLGPLAIPVTGVGTMMMLPGSEVDKQLERVLQSFSSINTKAGQQGTSHERLKGTTGAYHCTIAQCALKFHARN
jgi:hypothetical protein